MSKKVKHEYSDNELIRRVTDIEEVKKLANKRVYYMINEWREKELDELWVSESEHAKTASFGKNTGYYVGLDNIRAYYVTKHAADLGDGVGTMNAHPISTGLVKLAGDGKTAKGLWYSIGQDTKPNGDGTALAMWNTGKVAIDFVKEGDAWKIWHIVEANDATCEAGDTYGDHPVYIDYATDPVAVEFGTPTIPMITHDATFNWWDNYPAPPEDYETWSDELSYGPEGYPEKTEYHFGAGEGGNF